MRNGTKKMLKPVQAVQYQKTAEYGLAASVGAFTCGRPRLDLVLRSEPRPWPEFPVGGGRETCTALKIAAEMPKPMVVDSFVMV